MIERANRRLSEAIIKAPTVSEYFSHLWDNANIQQTDKDVNIAINYFTMRFS